MVPNLLGEIQLEEIERKCKYLKPSIIRLNKIHALLHGMIHRRSIGALDVFFDERAAGGKIVRTPRSCGSSSAMPIYFYRNTS